MNQNLYSRFSRAFAPGLDKPAVVTPRGETYRYADLEARSAAIAAHLVALGAHPGDRVTVQVGKSVEALWLYLACLRSGLVFHPLNDGYRRDEVAFLLTDAEPCIAVCDPAAEAQFRELAPTGCRVLTLDAVGKGSLLAATMAEAPAFETVARAAGDTAVLLYTSGTTGQPKGAMLSHGNLAANAATLASAWGFSATDRLLHALPIYHAHGLFVGLGCAFMSGASLEWLSRFDAGEVVGALGRSTVMMGVPTYYTRLLAEPSFTRERCATMRLFVSGSAPLSPETFAAFRERSGHAILERYGMTETGMNAANPLRGERRPGSVGPALPGVSIRIAGAASAGTIGEIEVRGPNVFSGYWRAPEKTAESFTADGWFRTGDQGFLDGDGYLTIAGRSKDLVISGGLNVYPREVELAIEQLPGVHEAAVIGVPHPDLGEAVVAIVTGNGIDEAAIMSALRGRLAGFKLPKRLVRKVALPRNAMGKIEKNSLRRELAGLFTTKDQAQ
ncbi:MAG: AMP-binding protein [Gammaproteobacteria bacterium]|nr:AMP-binding protein [Gammaproteobacteria bacterium]